MIIIIIIEYNLTSSAKHLNSSPKINVNFLYFWY